MLKKFKKFKILPKGAKPIDKLSFVGTASFSGATPSFRFTYQYKKRYYVIQCFGGFGAKIGKYVTTKDLFIENVFKSYKDTK